MPKYKFKFKQKKIKTKIFTTEKKQYYFTNQNKEMLKFCTNQM